MDVTPQALIEQTYNYYGLKADLAAAAEFIKLFVCATPGGFYEWLLRQDSSF